MLLKLRSRRFWASLSLAALSLGGCLVVAPLDSVPQPKSSHGGSSSTGGDGGSGDEPSDAAGSGNDHCRHNAECVERLGKAARCRPSDDTCVPLYSEACPLRYGDDYADDNAIFIGSFATLNPSAPEDNTVAWSQQLALGELSGDNRSGLPDGVDDAGRPLVLLICKNDEENVVAGLQHLADEVQVPAVLANLKPGDLRRAFQAHRELFYLSPVSVTQTIVEDDSSGHIWNLLGQPRDFAPTYQALLELSETYLRKTRMIDMAIPLKVAIITTTDAFGGELSEALSGSLRPNRKSLLENGAAVASFTIDEKSTDIDTLASEICDFAPDIIVSAASERFLSDGDLQQAIEDNWGLEAEKPQPFYILSPYDAGNLGDLNARLAGKVERDPNGKHAQRFVGVSIASAASNNLQNAYEGRLHSRFRQANFDSANYYDAFYYLAYAMYAANEPKGLTGDGIARGMQRLLSGTNVEVGPSSIAATFAALADTSASVHVQSTLGPPDFDAKTGVRHVVGSVFCFQQDMASLKPSFDVLRYDAALDALVGKSFPCVPDFYRP